MWLPMFPLQAVFFPGETVHLHIFEDRYKALIGDISIGSGVFGVPAYIDGKIAFGTEMRLEGISKTYPNGEMDIVCKAQRVFKILSFQNNMASKKYAGGEVSYLDYHKDGEVALIGEVLQLVVSLYQSMGASVLVHDTQQLDLHVWVHKVGLSLSQEYLLLQMAYESEQLLLLKHHLLNIIQVLEQVDRAKEMIGMNGHFKSFDPLDFKNFKL
ncbi:LON peptidase substrate-binding domain-containing protein [Arenibacter amylolyticus]|uniref:LON peptidase substrate-binding domain-containing protein n=1 Tax=Arenibacter amylolyticus TaxID=1406873 RepID=UPI000A38FDFD|nr:LON peptidase substrate-binding domain-containing protein [Arenibacter amylolyticus]